MSKHPNSQMTDEAIGHDESTGVPLYEVAKIYSDHEFNCRIDAANPMDSINLAKSIATKGLLQPIIIRPCGQEPNDPKEYDYVIVAGYRRYQAYRVNNHPFIPAILRANDSVEENKISNLVENLERKNLNMLEEARGIQFFYESGHSRDWIAEKVGMSSGWVQIRCMILELDPLVQQEIAAGTIISSHIRTLYTHKNDREKQIIIAKGIKQAREGGDKRASTVERILKKDEKPKATSKRRRTVKEIEDMMEHLHMTFGEYGFAGRALAWTAGQIPNYDFHQDIRDICIDDNVPYTIPEMSI